jgi:hypothetical protein
MRRDLEFTKGDKVFLKVALMKGVTRFGKGGKLNPRYIGPYKILERAGSLAYCVALPPHLYGSHNVFHVLALRKYVADLSHVLEVSSIPLRKICHTKRYLYELLIGRRTNYAGDEFQWLNYYGTIINHRLKLHGN